MQIDVTYFEMHYPDPKIIKIMRKSSLFLLRFLPITLVYKAGFYLRIKLSFLIQFLSNTIFKKWDGSGSRF